jgi:hypothetical protein
MYAVFTRRGILRPSQGVPQAIEISRSSATKLLPVPGNPHSITPLGFGRPNARAPADRDERTS